MKNKLNDFGIWVKKQLLDLKLQQREFCVRNDLNEYMFSDLLYGRQKYPGLKKKIIKAIGEEKKKKRGDKIG